MKIETTDLNRSNIYLVRVEGRLDAGFSSQLEDETDELLDKTKRIVMDFSEVTYLSSSGLRVLLSIKKETEKQGGLVLIHVVDAVRKIIEVAELQDFFDLAASLEQAIKILEEKNA